jgi:hypothetical protein
MIALAIPLTALPLVSERIYRATTIRLCKRDAL